MTSQTGFSPTQVGPDAGLARLIRDRDKTFGAAFDRRVDNLDLTQFRIAARSHGRTGSRNDGWALRVGKSSTT
jgi:hypothetical protein